MKKTIFFTAIALVLLISCTKSESPTVAPVSLAGGAIFRSQVVTLSLPDTNLTENEYQATLDGIAIKLTKSEDNKLYFFVPLATTIGTRNLVIPALNNVTIGYDVKDMGLTDTPEVTINALTTNLNTFSQTLDSSPESVNIQNSIINFNAVFSNASAADKIQMAIFYKANTTLFDAMILNDYSNVGGRRSASDIESEPALLAKFKASMFFMAAGRVISEIPGPVGALGILVAGVAMAKSLDYGNRLLKLNLNTVTVDADGVDGVNNRNVQNTVISFQDNVARTINFNTKNKQLLASDASNSHSEVALLFKFYNIYNAFVGKLNGAIQFVNTHVIFCDFSLLPLLQVPTTSTTVSNAINANTFSHITISISDPNLSLVSSSLQGDGQLNLNIKIIGTPATIPVVSTLNYTYTDAFSSFTGKLPITVSSSTLLIGQSYQGGKIAYLDGTGLHGLIVSNNICVSQGHFDIVNTYCNTYTSEGYSGWRLPTQDEFASFYGNYSILVGVLGNTANQLCWTSTVDNNGQYYGSTFAGGSPGYYPVDNNLCSAPVRSF